MSDREPLPKKASMLPLGSLQTLPLLDGAGAGICEIDPLTGLMVCELPAAASPENKSTNDVAPATVPERPTGDRN